MPPVTPVLPTCFAKRVGNTGGYDQEVVAIRSATGVEHVYHPDA